MIITEVMKIIRSSVDHGVLLNDLVNEFRRGREASEIPQLLNHPNSKLQAIGAWILSELPFEMYDDRRIVSILLDLTKHKSPIVRFEALSALSPVWLSDREAAHDVLGKMCNDSNKGVACLAKKAFDRIFPTRPEGERL